MSKINGGVKTMSSSKERRKRVIARLEAQLELGQKPFFTGKSFDEKDIISDNSGHIIGLHLTPKDRERIQNELSTLKTRI